MATPLSAAKIVDALRDEGVDVAEYRDWRNHNRNHKGSWGPVHGVMIHHTVTSGTDATVRLCYDGYSGLPGPLCHGVVAKDGTVHLVGHGRANHAGRGDDDVHRAVIAERSSFPSPNETNTDGNTHYYGFECINMGDGRDPWPESQLDAVARAAAAICRVHGWNERSVIGHAEWTNRKIDPRGPGKSAAEMMRDLRARVARLLADEPSGSTPTGGTYTVQGGDTLSKIADRYPGVTWQDIAKASRLADPDKIFPGDKLTIPGARTYTVKKGDTLSGIAQGYKGVTWQEIARANRITAPYTIHPGDVLVIPS